MLEAASASLATEPSHPAFALPDSAAEPVSKEGRGRSGELIPAAPLKAASWGHAS